MCQEIKKMMIDIDNNICPRCGIDEALEELEKLESDCSEKDEYIPHIMQLLKNPNSELLIWKDIAKKEENFVKNQDKL